MNWFFESGGKQQGPVSDAELDQLIAQGTVTAGTLVWRQGQGDWLPLSAARPARMTPPPMGAIPIAAEVPPGHVRCTLTGKVIPDSEAVYIQGKPYSAEAKPAVLQSLQTGSELPVTDDERNGPPWERRKELGIIKAAWETIREVLMNPGVTFSRMRREGGTGTPLLFYVLVGTIAGVVGMFYQFALGGILPTAQQAGAGTFLTGAMGSGLGLAAGALILPIMLTIGAYLYSGILHVSLMICGGAKRPFENTFRVLCYAQGAAAALQIIPVCGAFVAGIWAIVAVSIGFAKTHEIGTGRAVLAVLLPLIVCIGGAIGVGIFAFSMAQGTHH